MANRIKGITIADCLADRTDYAKNPDKTNDGELLSSYECYPRTVQGEFMLSKRQYDDITGRKQAGHMQTGWSPICPACHFCSQTISVSFTA